MNPESWIHRFQNLKLFNNLLQDFYKKFLYLQYDIQKTDDLMKIAKNKDRKNIISIIRNLLGACINVKFNKIGS